MDARTRISSKKRSTLFRLDRHQANKANIWHNTALLSILHQSTSFQNILIKWQWNSSKKMFCKVATIWLITSFV